MKYIKHFIVLILLIIRSRLKTVSPIILKPFYFYFISKQSCFIAYPRYQKTCRLLHKDIKITVHTN